MLEHLVSPSDVSTSENLRNVFIEKIYSIQDSLYPLNLFTAHLLITKNSSFLKKYAVQNPPHSITPQDYNLLISSLTQLEISSAQDYVNNNSLSYYPTYVFFGSKDDLRSHFFEFYPSVFSSLFDYLISSGTLVKSGTGKGRAFLFLPSILDLDFSDYSFAEDDQNILDSFLSFHNSIKDDNNYLLSVIEQKDNYIQTLHEKINSLAQQNYISYHSTWR